MTETGRAIECEVVVIGGGLAGMAASIHLSRAGMKVICIDGEPGDRDPVGESLDWSAPALLKAVGLPVEDLLERGIATSKRHVILKLLDGSERHYVPGDWLGRSPFHVELSTIHVDRAELGKALREIVGQQCIEVVTDRVVHIERIGRRVTSINTHQGQRFIARWFIDASGGSARLFARAFDLPSREYGPNKVAMWNYFRTPDFVEGTTLYGSATGGDVAPNYMEWIWQIPIRPDMVSVGCVATGEAVKEQRQRGMNVEEIYTARLNEFSSLAPLVQNAESPSPRVTSFRCRIHEKVSGPNWLVAGEAASMVDPMTSNGVTAALRHAAEASCLIIRSRHRTRLPRLASMAYAWRVRDLARFFNSGIEKVIYEGPIRVRVGALLAGDIYTIPAWLMNLFYARIQPEGIVTSACFGMALRLLRGCAAVFSRLCRFSYDVANEAI